MIINYPILQESGVALTDYLLALESIILVFLSIRFQTRKILPRWLVASFFTSLAVSSLLGGTYHGFFPEKTASITGWSMWIATMLSIGITSVIIWQLVWTLLIGKRSLYLFSTVPLLLFLFFGIYVIQIDHSFKIAILFYAPATIALLLSLIWLYLKNRRWQILVGTLGILVTFIAAYIQQTGNNVLYHLLQGAGLLLLFIALRFILTTSYDAQRKK